jgi:transcriptional regulator with XRE-family HTH domain
MVTKKKTTGEAMVDPTQAQAPGEEARLNQMLGVIDFDSFGDPKPDSVAIELKKAREAKGLTFSDLHRLTAISRTTLHDYESGRSMPGAKELVKLCQVLEVTPNRLLLGMDDLSTLSGGVLVALIGLAKAKPTQALALSAFLLPWVSAVLSKIGYESLMALGTLADETLRARDPETYRHLSIFVAEIQGVDFDALARMSPAEKDKAMAEIGKRMENIKQGMEK